MQHEYFKSYSDALIFRDKCYELGFKYSVVPAEKNYWIVNYWR